MKISLKATKLVTLLLRGFYLALLVCGFAGPSFSALIFYNHAPSAGASDFPASVESVFPSVKLLTQMLN